MNGLNHVDDYPEIPVSLAPTNTLLKTGAWRSVRPVLAERAAPCSAGCPAGVEVPTYLDDIKEGRLHDAFDRFTERNPFPRITGRVCPHPCEDRCNLAIALGEEPVSIRSVERWLGDIAKHFRDPIPELETGKRIGVVGSGPAGMAAAFYLRRSGHRVTVFDRRRQPGGILRYGIPDYRLPSDVVDSEIERLIEMGVEFQMGVTLGVDTTIAALEAAYAAIFLATGAGVENPAGIAGESLLEPGLAFLEKANRGIAQLPGKRCAVVGGGNVAMDVARVLLRLGATVTVLYRRTAAEMPAIREEYERAVADGVDFEWLTGAKSVTKAGPELLLTAAEMRLADADSSGRRRPEPTGITRELRFDAIFSAIGESPDAAPFPESMKGKDGRLVITDGGKTQDPVVFAGGDLATGPATVVDAIAAGRNAARAIDTRLGFSDRWPQEEPREIVAPTDLNLTYLPHHNRSDDPDVEGADRFSEETNTMSDSDVLQEIDRCISCGHCNACGTCFVFCPDGAIIWRDGPVIDHEFCKGCGICVTECPGSAMILVNERELTNA